MAEGVPNSALHTMIDAVPVVSDEAMNKATSSGEYQNKHLSTTGGNGDNLTLPYLQRAVLALRRRGQEPRCLYNNPS